MQFRIADTFTDSLSRLTGEEQKAVKTTAFDLLMNPGVAQLRFLASLGAGRPNSSFLPAIWASVFPATLFVENAWC